MKTYNKPIAHVVELAVKESLSDIPLTFKKMAKLSGAKNKNVAYYSNRTGGSVVTGA